MFSANNACANTQHTHYKGEQTRIASSILIEKSVITLTYELKKVEAQKENRSIFKWKKRTNQERELKMFATS